jgi:hypothetical protein
MEDKKEDIEKLRAESIQKRRVKEFFGAALLLVALVSAGFLVSKTFELEENTGEQSVNYDKQVIIGQSIQPFRTTIKENGTVKFINNKSQAVSISFETYSIDEKFEIGAGSSMYFNSSEYESLPKTNYFNLGDGDTGQLIISD